MNYDEPTRTNMNKLAWLSSNIRLIDINWHQLTSINMISWTWIHTNPPFPIHSPSQAEVWRLGSAYLYFASMRQIVQALEQFSCQPRSEISGIRSIRSIRWSGGGSGGELTRLRGQETSGNMGIESWKMRFAHEIMNKQGFNHGLSIEDGNVSRDKWVLGGAIHMPNNKRMIHVICIEFILGYRWIWENRPDF